MAQAYTAPNWSTGEGISVSNLQAISNTLEGIVQGSDKAVHSFDISNANVTVTYVDGTVETYSIAGLKGIYNIFKQPHDYTRPMNEDTYTITYTDGTSFDFRVTNGINGTNGTNGVGISSITESQSGNVHTITITLTNGMGQEFEITDGEDGSDGNGIEEISVNKVGNKNYITITETNGTATTFDISDGINTEEAEEVIEARGSYESLSGRLDGADEAISNRIKKFYSTNAGSTNLTDSDEGEIKSLVVWGRCEQGENPSPTNPQTIHSVVEPSVVVSDENHQTPQTATLTDITLNAIPVASGGNVTIDGQQYIADYVDVEQKKIVRNVGVVDLSTLTWDSTTYNDFYKNGTLRFKKSTSQNSLPFALAERYVGMGWNPVSRNDKAFALSAVNSAPYDIIVSKGIDETPRGKLIYVLATPTTENLTDEQIADFIALQTYYGTTNVNVVSDDLSSNADFIYPISIENGWNWVKQQIGDNRDYIYNVSDLAEQSYIASVYAEVLAELSIE